MNDLFIRAACMDWDGIGKDSYLWTIPAIAGVERVDFERPVTCFVGENGSGKSTLLEAMAVSYGFNPEGGTKNYSFSTFDSHSELCDSLRLIRGPRKARWGYFLRAESFYNVATAEAAYSQSGGTPQHLHEKSHGESFLATVQNNFRGGGVYLLDEPEAALSPQRQLTLLREIHTCAQTGAQFFIVTHSPILLGLPGAAILSFDDGPIHPIAYEETDSYQITSLFLSDRQRILRSLLEE
jgi:predicted ATPase